MKTKNLVHVVAMLLAVFSSGYISFADDITESSVSPSVIFELLALNRDLPTLQKPKYLSPADMVPSPDGMLLYVAEQTAKRIDAVDVEARTVAHRTL